MADSNRLIDYDEKHLAVSSSCISISLLLFLGCLRAKYLNNVWSYHYKILSISVKAYWDLSL